VPFFWIPAFFMLVMAKEPVFIIFRVEIFIVLVAVVFEILEEINFTVPYINLVCFYVNQKSSLSKFLFAPVKLA
jgi:hypothetical protein